VKAIEIRKISSADLEKRIVELKKELFNLRFQLAVGQLENTARISQVKKTIAQMKTIISERGE
jgi:large subunit ribosomal protein L29